MAIESNQVQTVLHVKDIFHNSWGEKNFIFSQIFQLFFSLAPSLKNGAAYLLTSVSLRLLRWLIGCG